VVAEPSIAALKGTGSKIKVYQDSAVLLFFIKVNSIRNRERFFQNIISSRFPIRHHPLKSLILLYLQRACRDFDGSLDPMTRIKQVKQTERNDIRG
jgi:hypothetical protein